MHDRERTAAKAIRNVLFTRIQRLERKDGRARCDLRVAIGFGRLELFAKRLGERRWIDHDSRRVCGQIVEDRLELLVERGQESVDPEEHPAALEIVEELLRRARR